MSARLCTARVSDEDVTDSDAEPRAKRMCVRACVYTAPQTLVLRSARSASPCLPVRAPLARQKRSRSGSTARMSSCLLRCVSLDGAAFSSLAHSDSSVGILTLLTRFSVSVCLSFSLSHLPASILLRAHLSSLIAPRDLGGNRLSFGPQRRVSNI